MTNDQIRTKINENNKKIEDAICTARFTLDIAINDLLEENSKLRQQCTHEFHNGFCIFCDIPEEFK